MFRKNSGIGGELAEKFLLSNGMIHMAYRAEAKEEILCRFGVPGSERLSGAFTAFIEEYLPHLPEKLPLVMEISGAEFPSAEKNIIENTIHETYDARLAGIRRRKRSAVIRMLWFSVSLILSGLLLLNYGQTENFLETQFAYLPFWFFGYRMIDFLVLQMPPYLKERDQAVQLASMKVVFTGTHPVNEVRDENRERYADEVEEQRNDPQAGDYALVQESFVTGQGNACIRCHVKNAAEVLPPCGIRGYEVISGEFASFIEQNIPYLPEKLPVTLELSGTEATSDERKVIKEAVRSHFAFRMAEAEAGVKKSCYRIGIFLLCLILASGTLLFTGGNLNPAITECFTMIFWFFGDYLIEYVILGHAEALRNRRTAVRMYEMKIRFGGKDAENNEVKE